MQIQSKRLLITIIIASIVIHVASLVLGNTVFQGWTFSHLPIHSALEISGTLIAFIVARLLLQLDKLNKGTSYNNVIASALINMGLLDGIHALLDVSNSFVWFHSIATFIGGLLFSSVFIPQHFIKRNSKIYILGSISLTLALAIISLIYPGFQSPMVLKDSFSDSAMFLNIFGGILLLISSLKILITYRQSKEIDDLLFFLHCLLFGLAATMFQESQLWDITWWGWHVLRFMAYIVALHFILISLNLTQAELHEKHSQELLDRLEYTLGTANLGLWDYDFKQDKLTWDLNMYRIYRQDPETFNPGDDGWTQLIHPEDQGVTEKFYECIQNNTLFDASFRICTADQQIRHIRSKARFEFDEQGNPSFALGVNWDMTDEVTQNQEISKLYHELEVQKASIDQTAIFEEMNLQLEIQYVNHKFEQIYGYTLDEIQGKTHSIADSKFHTKEFYQNVLSTIQSGEAWHGEMKEKAKDGTLFWVETHIYPIKDTFGEIIRYHIIRFDISELKATQEKLEESTQLAQQALASKSNFLSNMSHEIRTPMNGILGASELLLDTPLNNEQEEYSHLIYNSTKSLLVIINDILDYSKIEQGKFTIEEIPFNYHEVLRDSIHLFQNAATQKGLTIDLNISTDTPKQLISDPTRLRQVLLNLLSNAIKFSERGGVCINVDVETKAINLVKVTTKVSDTGIGMTPDQVVKVFERFTQADSSTSRRFGGTGLGTSISLKLCELLGGQMKVESHLGVGTTFIFEIPMRIANIKSKPKSSLSTHVQFNHELLLLVEDNPTNQKIASKILSKMGLDIIIASDGNEAIKMYQEFQPKLIFMDIQMPVMDGIEATQHIREMDHQIPIIALTANIMKEDVDRYKEVGMNTHIGKPFQKAQLLSVLQEYL